MKTFVLLISNLTYFLCHRMKVLMFSVVAMVYDPPKNKFIYAYIKLGSL